MRKNPLSIVNASMPYYMEQVDRLTWKLMNRDYKPVIALTSKGEYEPVELVFPKALAQSFLLKLAQDKEGNYSTDEDGKICKVYLYDESPFYLTTEDQGDIFVNYIKRLNELNKKTNYPY